MRRIRLIAVTVVAAAILVAGAQAAVAGVTIPGSTRVAAGRDGAGMEGLLDPSGHLHRLLVDARGQHLQLGVDDVCVHGHGCVRDS